MKFKLNYEGINKHDKLELKKPVVKRKLKTWVKITIAFICGVLFTLFVQFIADYHKKVINGEIIVHNHTEGY